MATYREYAPSPLLRDYVECYWSREGKENPPAAHRVLPDGCVDILFDFASNSTHAFVIGPMTRAIVVNAPAPEKYVAVRFHPGGASAFFNLPLNAIADATVHVGDFWKDTAAFESSVIEAASIPEQIAALENALLSRLHSTRALDQQVQLAIRLFKAKSGMISIDAVSSNVGISRQHLNRKFQDRVGINAKLFARIVRMQDLLRRVRNVCDVDWCTLALDSGYYDQAHMIDDFRDLCGISPTRYLASV